MTGFQIYVHEDLKKAADNLKQKLNESSPEGTYKKTYSDVFQYLLTQSAKADFLSGKIELLYTELIDKLKKIKDYIESKTFTCTKCGEQNGMKIKVDYNEIFLDDEDVKLIRELKNNGTLV